MEFRKRTTSQTMRGLKKIEWPTLIAIRNPFKKGREALTLCVFVKQQNNGKATYQTEDGSKMSDVDYSVAKSSDVENFKQPLVVPALNLWVNEFTYDACNTCDVYIGLKAEQTGEVCFSTTVRPMPPSIFADVTLRFCDKCEPVSVNEKIAFHKKAVWQ